MPRSIEIAAPSDKVDSLVDELKEWDGVIGLRIQRNVSLKPRGDVLALEIIDKQYAHLMQLLDRRQLLSDPTVSITSSLPLSIISRPSSSKIITDSSESNWEEMQSTINRQSNMTINNLIVMFVSGVLAVIGILTNAIHIVVGAMVIAPGFEPIVRIALGFVSQHTDWKNGLTDTIKAYTTLIIGAMLTALVMDGLGKSLTSGDTTYLSSGALISYWTTINTSSILVTLAAALAGPLIILSHRSVLTAGVMIALALVPATAIIGIGLVAGDFDMAGKAFQRLLIEVGIIAISSLIILVWKKSTVHRRRMFS